MVLSDPNGVTTMSDDKVNPHEPPIDRSQPVDVLVRTKKAPHKRLCAFLIDCYILVIIFGITMIIATAGIDPPGLLLSVWILAPAYLLLRDALFHGKSIGKCIVGLRVVDIEGQPCNLWRSGLRNLILIAPIVILGQFVENVPPNIGPVFVAACLLVYFYEYLLVWLSKDQRRLGDRMAGTKVQDIKPDRPDWWFLLFSILLIFVVPPVVSFILGMVL